MELHRARKALPSGSVFALAGLSMVVLGWPQGGSGSIGLLLLGALALLVGGGTLVGELRPFTFRIDTEGLTMRGTGVNRPVPWSEIDSVVLDQPIPGAAGHRSPSPRLLLVPAAGVDPGIRLPLRSPVDDRPALLLLDLARVREPVQQVREALARFAGDRFVDDRPTVETPDFAVGLRGYDIAAVHTVIRRAQRALDRGGEPDRQRARTELTAALGKLPVAGRGYDRRQVESYLDDLARKLVGRPEERPDVDEGAPSPG
ncbi:hypothetical protein [Micromonospora echinofusca]|uniref:DivIVA domain-containing protein n=1 Tax=Micromonospora echinofusca TaxID=47858 RepID=A0ABS3VPT2_MICEH|nr:hypothetical protein [Micromonospora echinofusca]MBO4206520.1 hypothetical protein [Micromonospora echinofusca]